MLAVVTLAAFWQVIGSQFINYDDDDYVTANPHIRSLDIAWAFTTFREANWHPLTWISHMIDYRLFGMNPAGPHAVNLLIHIASVILLFLVLRRMTGLIWTSAFVAALFAVHPLHVESVAWVAERKDVLGGFFWMLTMLLYVRYTERPGVRRYIPVVVAFALGLMCKPMLVTLPFILLLLDFWPLQRLGISRRGGLQRPPAGQASKPTPTECRPEGGRPLKASPTVIGVIYEKMPLIGMAVASGIVTFAAQHRGLAVGSLEHYPLGVRIANALVAYVAYLVKTVYPTKLAVFYPHPGSSLPGWQVIGSGILLIGITALVIRSARSRPHLLVGWLWYVITLLPVIGLVQVGMQAMADRYTYIPLIGVFLMLGYGSMGVWEYGRPDSRTPTPPHPHTPILSILVIAVLLPITWRQVGYWHDSETLFRHALAVTRNNAVAENNLGLALIADGNLDEGIRHHYCAVDANPGWADAHYSLGAALLEKSDIPDAVSEFEKTLALDPNHAQALNNLGTILMQTDDLLRAIENLRRAVQVRPDYAQAHNNLGMAYSLQGKLDESLEQFIKAVKADPSLPDGHYNLAIGLGAEEQDQGGHRGMQEGAGTPPELARGAEQPRMVPRHCSRRDRPRLEGGRPSCRAGMSSHGEQQSSVPRYPRRRLCVRQPLG